MGHKILQRGALVSCVLLICYTLYVPIWTTASSLEQNTSLLWAFVAITGAENQRKLMPVTSDSVLYSGDKFKLMFEARETLFVYIIFAGSEGEIVLLHPTTLKSEIRPSAINRRVFIPNERDWFTLDQKTGTETLYLLASSSPLAELESQLERYDSASRKDSKEIVQTIVNLIEKQEMLSQPLTAAAEKPLLIGGTIRSLSEQHVTKEDVNKFAEKIAVNDIFVRTYTIDHR